MTESVPDALRGRAWDEVLPELVADRARKPRRTGVTMVLDRCQGLRATEDLLELTGDYVDQIKLGFGTTVLLSERLLRRKIEIIRARDIEVYPGGTLFEAAVFKGVMPAYLRRARDLGFTAVEISDGTLDLSDELRFEAIRRSLDLGLKVFTEVGKKDPQRQPAPERLGDQIVQDLEMGADKVIVEGRESGAGVGVYDAQGNVIEERLERLLAGLSPAHLAHVIWETPQASQQKYFVQRFGANANLGNLRPNDVLALEALRCGLRWETFRALAGAAGALEELVGVND